MSKHTFSEPVIFKMTKAQRQLLDIAVWRAGTTLSHFLRTLLDTSTASLRVQAQQSAIVDYPKHGTDLDALFCAAVASMHRKEEIASLERQASELLKP